MPLRNEIIVAGFMNEMCSEYTVSLTEGTVEQEVENTSDAI